MTEKQKLPTTTQEAIEAGYTKSIFAEGHWYALTLLVKPDEDLDGPFNAFDCDENEMLMNTGWLFETTEIDHNN